MSPILRSSTVSPTAHRLRGGDWLLPELRVRRAAAASSATFSLRRRARRARRWRGGRSVSVFSSLRGFVELAHHLVRRVGARRRCMRSGRRGWAFSSPAFVQPDAELAPSDSRALRRVFLRLAPAGRAASAWSRSMSWRTCSSLSMRGLACSRSRALTRLRRRPSMIVLRQAQPLGDGKGVGLAGDADEQVVRRAQGVHVELAARRSSTPGCVVA